MTTNITSSWADKPAAYRSRWRICKSTTTCHQDRLLDLYISTLVTTCHQDQQPELFYHQQRLILPFRIWNRNDYHHRRSNVLPGSGTGIGHDGTKLDRHGIQWSSWFGGNRDSEPSSQTLHSLQNVLLPNCFSTDRRWFLTCDQRDITQYFWSNNVKHSRITTWALHHLSNQCISQRRASLHF